MNYKAKLTTFKSRSRRRTESAAIELLFEVRLAPAQRRSAIDRIRRAPQPTAEAKRIVAHAAREAVRRALNGNDLRPGAEVDHSDVQELRAKIIRRDGAIVEPYASLLRQLDGRIASDGVSRREFEEVASSLWAMPQALPKKKIQSENTEIAANAT